MGRHEGKKGNREKVKTDTLRGGSKNGLSLDNFIRAKQNDPGLHRQRKRKAFIENAKIVNKYKRLLKREGIQMHKGQVESTESNKKRSAKPDRFMKSVKEAELRKESKEQELLRGEEQKSRQAELQMKRKKKSQSMRRRTKKGQPILKFQVQSILERLSKEQDK